MKVWAKNEAMRKLLVHPANKVAFPLNIEESLEWPDDQFTYKRLRDGDILDHPPSQARDKQEAKDKAAKEPPKDKPDPTQANDIKTGQPSVAVDQKK